MSYSMYKTFARKYKSSVKKILFQYKKDGTFKVAYENSKGKTLYQSFYHDGFKRKNRRATSCDTIPRTVTITGGRNSLMERLKPKSANYAVLRTNSKCTMSANSKT